MDRVLFITNGPGTTAKVVIRSIRTQGPVLDGIPYR